ncbi:MAG: alpha/beta hydrolase [Pseudohongiella sp.]|uniref:alpha/beta fold hydrolase n=1 Tax=Pseudohongiella sp. TaxID=1979412 RepID=UPI0034A07690
MALALTSCMSRVASTDIEYQTVDAGVAYSAVEALTYREPHARIAYGNDPLQHGLLWLPKEQAGSARSADKAPVVVLIHGGCWLNAYDINHTYALSTALAQAGYAVWSLEYRRSGDAGGGWPGTYQDVLAGINHIEQLQNYPIDNGRFVIVGHSAGGHLALLAGRETPAASAVVGLAAITDIIAYAAGSNSCETATARFMGGTPQEMPADYAAANPADHTTHATTLLLHGGSDALVSVNQALLVGARTLFVESAGHFDWVHPGTRSFNVLLSTLQSVLAE